MTEAAPAYGMTLAKVAPESALIPCELLMIASLVRLTQSGDQGWWIAAGLCGGLALTAKYTAILLAPAILAFVLVPAWRMRQLSSPYFWIAILLALLVFSPTLYWNAAHGWVSFQFQLNRPPQVSGWSTRFLVDFVGQQFAMVGVLLLPLAVFAASMLAGRGYRNREPIAVLLSTAVIFPLLVFVVRSLSSRVGDGWPLFVWPIAF